MAKAKTTAEITLFASQPDDEVKPLQSWALVELYGHARIVGRVTVDPPDFPGMVRVDVPDLIVDGKIKKPGFTRYVGKNALYSVSPCDEKDIPMLLSQIDGMPARAASFAAYGERY